MPALSPDIESVTQPVNTLERWFAEEIEYAAAEMDRVRAHRANTAAELRLNAAYSRASRNWNRARKELAALQNARATHATRLDSVQRAIAAVAPLGSAARITLPKAPEPATIDLLIRATQSGFPMPNPKGGN